MTDLALTERQLCKGTTKAKYRDTVLVENAPAVPNIAPKGAEYCRAHDRDPRPILDDRLHSAWRPPEPKPDPGFWKVRLMFAGGTLHVATEKEPYIIWSEGERIIPDCCGWLDDPACGDSIGFINWSAVVAITWRWHHHR